MVTFLPVFAIYHSGGNVGRTLYWVATLQSIAYSLFHKIVFTTFNIVVLYGSTLRSYRSNLMLLKGVAVFCIN